MSFSPFVSTMLDRYKGSMGLYIRNLENHPDPFKWEIVIYHMFEDKFSVVSRDNGSYFITGIYSKQICEEFLEFAQQTAVLFI